MLAFLSDSIGSFPEESVEGGGDPWLFAVVGPRPDIDCDPAAMEGILHS